MFIDNEKEEEELCNMCDSVAEHLDKKFDVRLRNNSRVILFY
jgi:hypothetical protein